MPPLARSTWPLIQPPSGPTRKATAEAMSSGVPRRSSGCGYLDGPDAPFGPEPTLTGGVDGGHRRFVMQTFIGMILGALLLVCGVYIYDSMRTSSVANVQVAETNRTIVNWDVAAADWRALRTRAHDDWIRISSK